MLNLNVEITGKTFYDLELALRECLKHAENNVWMAMDGNDDGNYSYTVSGDEEEELEDEENSN